MVDALYRGNIEELLSVINHLKKYIIVFVIVLLVLLSIFHFSKYSVHVVPLVTVTLVLLPAVYYTTVLVLKFVTSVIASNQTVEATTMNASDGEQGLKTPDLPYLRSPTPPPSYEEATRNDHIYQPQPWLPSTSSGYTSGSVPGVFNVEYQYNAAAWPGVDHGRITAVTATTTTTTPAATSSEKIDAPKTAPKIQNIPSVTITLEDDPMDI